MTPLQYYFPYFFNLDKFNKELRAFNLASSVLYDEKIQVPESLLLRKQNSQYTLLTIPFGATLMIEENKLYYWKTDADQVAIVQVDLMELAVQTELHEIKIDLSQLQVGKNEAKFYLEVERLVTYARKESLTYNQDYYENFVIVIIEKAQINLIPFDWFNRIGGDYGYVWPATARLDNRKLHGQGMRMSNFTVELEKACL